LYRTQHRAAKNYQKGDEIEDPCTSRAEQIAEALVLRLLSKRMNQEMKIFNWGMFIAQRGDRIVSTIHTAVDQ